MTTGEKILVQAAAVLLILTPVGCVTSGKILDLGDVAEHDQMVNTAAKPVIVEYYKDVCPPCDWQVVELERLYDAYGTRIMFLKLKVRHAWITPIDAEFVGRTGLTWTPTTIMYVDGQEVYRWITFESADKMQPIIELILESAE